MIQEEFQDSDSSSNGNSELVIKPPQSLSLSSSIFCQNEKKKRRHSKDHKSNKRHHHSHRDGHIKSLDVDSGKRNQNDTEIKRKDQSKKPKMSSTKEDVRDTKSKKMLKNIAQEITDVRQVRTNTKDVRESKSFNYRNEDRNTYFLEEMKIEWRHKRLQWLQHQKKQNEKLQIEEETGLQGTKSKGELSEQHKNIMTGCSQSKMSSTECFQLDDEINYSIISPEISSEEENTDYREDTKSIKLIDVENECLTEQENTTSVSDTSNDNDSGHNAASKKSEGNVETESISENEKIISKKESLHTEFVGETISTAIFVTENLDAKLMGENEKSMISSEKCPSLASTSNTHPPKLPVYCPAIQGCRSVDGFQVLNRIEEGTYGVVYRAKDKETKEIVALKRLKMEREKEGFPITSLREINTLLKAQHPNIVTVREIVVGSNMDRIYIVMDYVEHDLKSLMKTMPRPFLIGEVKTLLMQLLCAVAHLHDNWILHRDLKTSNLLLSHQGILKVGDFGLAREYGSPLKSYTPVVVTLWYRAPELLLGAKKYSTPIDMWSVGCIFGELLTKNALFPGKSESDQLNRIFKDLGTPSENIWPGYSELPLVQSINITQYPYNVLKNRFSHTFTDLGFDLLNKFLTYNPARRISAENAKNHEYFTEKPKPIPPNMFPIWPAKSERQNRTARSSPKPPLGGMHYSRQ